ncbi:MAG TPA: hypothetical protein VK488_05370 [Gaiellaceae bacterium]|nr:hypothetical protein [Gaiellaceae bacterium]
MLSPRPVPADKGGPRWAYSLFKLEQADGTPADPATFETAVPDWQAGDEIPLGNGRSLRVIGTRPDETPVLIVEEAG